MRVRASEKIEKLKNKKPSLSPMSLLSASSSLMEDTRMIFFSDVAEIGNANELTALAKLHFFFCDKRTNTYGEKYFYPTYECLFFQTSLSLNVGFLFLKRFFKPLFNFLTNMI